MSIIAVLKVINAECIFQILKNASSDLNKLQDPENVITYVFYILFNLRSFDLLTDNALTMSTHTIYNKHLYMCVCVGVFVIRSIGF